MLVTCQQMQAAEERVFNAGAATPESLMDRAAAGLAAAVRQFWPEPGCLVAFCGKGHNGGDALAAAAILADADWQVTVRLVAPESELKDLTRKKLGALRKMAPDATVTESEVAPDIIRAASRGLPLVVFDGLLGIGASGPLRDDFRELCRELNRFRDEAHARVVAIDIPTGLEADSGRPDPDAVVADVTVTIAVPKTGLVADAAVSHVGRIAVVPLPELEPDDDADAFVITPDVVAPWLWRRSYDSHKGDAGRIGIVAGSAGTSGAAALCAAGALRAGGGLVTVFTHESGYAQVAALTRPEIMVRSVGRLTDALDAGLDAIAVGPGLGLDRKEEILELVEKFGGPMVVDADGLNALADGGLDCLDRAAGPRLLTPHPGEMKRLLGGKPVGDRKECARAFASRHPNAALLLKGARTVIAVDGCPVAVNSTGNPGLASGGSGDTLTGICAALARRATDSRDLFRAACLAAWLGGRAAELAVSGGRRQRQSEESLAASDIARNLGRAFTDLRQGCW